MIHTEEILLILQIAYLERKKTYHFYFLKKIFECKKYLIVYYFISIPNTIQHSQIQPKNLRILPDYKVIKCQNLHGARISKTGQKFDLSGKEFTINNEMSCHNRNLIYAITCSVYGELYIVETGNTLRERKRINKQHINLPEYRIIKLGGVI